MRSLLPLLATSLALFLASGVAFFPQAISSEGTAKVDYLLKTLETASHYKVRIAAASGLGKIADGTVADWMARAFRREENPAVRLAILYAIGEIPDHRIIPPLVELANEEILREGELLAIERVLWNFRRAIHTQSWEQAAVQSSDRKERATAAWLLGVTGKPSSLHALLRALQDPSAYVRMRAAQGVARLGIGLGRSACARVAKNDSDIAVRRVAKNCVGILTLTQQGKLPQKKSHRVNLKADLYGLQVAAVTPATYRRYVQRNVNPRVVEKAVASLTSPNRAEERKDRTITLVRSEKLRKTFTLDVSLITKYHLQMLEIDRLRRVVRAEAPSANRCYLQGLKNNRHLRGNVVLQFRILTSGTVSTIQILRASLPDINVQRCIAEKIKAIRFPKIPLAFVQMNYTFTFIPPKDQKFTF